MGKNDDNCSNCKWMRTGYCPEYKEGRIPAPGDWCKKHKRKVKEALSRAAAFLKII